MPALLDRGGAPRVAIGVSPTGAHRRKSDFPNLPLSGEEIAHCAAACRDAGASMIHLHLRDRHGRHLLDADAYRSLLQRVRLEVESTLVLQITTESLGLYRREEQVAIVKEVRPESASLALRELVPDGASEAGFSELLEWMKRNDVMPQVILHSVKDCERLVGLFRRGMFPWDNVPLLFVLGSYDGVRPSQPCDLIAYLEAGLGGLGHWMVCAFGKEEARCGTTAALLGGHLRVGFENNVLLPDGTPAEDNAALVRAAASLVTATRHELADAPGLRAAWRRST